MWWGPSWSDKPPARRETTIKEGEGRDASTAASGRLGWSWPSYSIRTGTRRKRPSRSGVALRKPTLGALASIGSTLQTTPLARKNPPARGAPVAGRGRGAANRRIEQRGGGGDRAAQGEG